MEMKLPELGEGVLEAELVEWRIAPDDNVAFGEVIAEVLTDKASIDLPSSFHGRVVELLAQPGQSIAVGEPVLRFEQASREATSADDASGPTPQGKTTSNGNGRAATTPDVPAPSSSAVAARSRDPQRLVARPKAAPAVRRRARQLEIDLTCVNGTGPGGRIVMEDLTAFVENPSQGGPSGASAATAGVATRSPQTKTTTDDKGPQPGSRIPLIGLRKKIAEHMVRSKTEIPHYSFVDECDVTDLVRIRERLKPEMAKDDVKLTYLAFVVKATAEALREFPLINASLDAEQNEIVLHDHYHIGVATATPKGLVVPVIKNADQLGLKQIAQSIQELSGKARDGGIGRDDLLGATFVITSIGGIGGLISTPIINQPNVGIMGLGKIVKRPMYDDAGAIHPADMMYLSYSFDHRVIDGAIGAEFNNAVIRRLQNPTAWLIPV